MKFERLDSIYKEKNMKCNSCYNTVNRTEQKILCTNCNSFLHTKCARISKAELEYFEKTKQVYKCEKCINSRRKTLLPQEQSSVSSGSPIAVNSTIQQPQNVIVSTMLSPSSVPIQADLPKNVTLDLLFGEIIKLQQLNSDALSKIKFLEDQTNTLLEKNASLSNKVVSLESKVNMLEQKEIKNCIDIVNIPVSNVADVNDSVIQLISKGVGIEMDADAIESCFIKKVNKNKKSDSSSAVNIVCVRFRTSQCKQLIMNKIRINKIKLNANIFGGQHNKKNIFINDSLTAYTRSLFKKANLLKLNNDYKYVWIRNSSIFMRKKEGDKVIKINSFEDFSKI